MSQQLAPIVFDENDLTPYKEEVVLGKNKFWLHEALEDEAVKYNNARAKAARMMDGKVVGVDGVADIEPFLVSLCLYKSRDDGSFPYLPNGTDPDPKYRVPLPWVRKLQARVVARLFARVKTISDLDDDTEESLTRQLKDIQERLSVLRSRNGNPVGNESDSSADS